MVLDTGPDPIKDCGRVASMGDTLDVVCDEQMNIVKYIAIDEEGEFDMEAHRRMWVRWTN